MELYKIFAIINRAIKGLHCTPLELPGLVLLHGKIHVRWHIFETGFRLAGNTATSNQEKFCNISSINMHLKVDLLSKKEPCRGILNSWWRHQMETFSALLVICEGNSPVNSEFPAQGPVTRSFDIFFICAWINDWVNNREADDFRRHLAH